MIESTIAITCIGFIATLLTSLIAPRQLIHIIKHKEDVTLLSSVSILSIAFIVNADSLWIAYGFKQNAIWASIQSAVGLLTQSGIIFFLIKSQRMKNLQLIGVILLSILGFMIIMWNPHIIVIGIIVSSVMYIPQVISIIKAWGTRNSQAFNTPSTIIMILANVFWLLYAVALKDIYLAISPPLLVISGLLMLSSQLAYKNIK